MFRLRYRRDLKLSYVCTKHLFKVKRNEDGVTYQSPTVLVIKLSPSSLCYNQLLFKSVSRPGEVSFLEGFSSPCSDVLNVVLGWLHHTLTTYITMPGLALLVTNPTFCSFLHQPHKQLLQPLNLFTSCVLAIVYGWVWLNIQCAYFSVIGVATMQLKIACFASITYANYANFCKLVMS